MNKQFREVTIFKRSLRITEQQILLLAIILFSGFYYSGISAVPFHPDESTQIFMSSDFIDTFTNPNNLAWDSHTTEDKHQHYRLVDPPLTRYMIGFGLWITGNSHPYVDWNWSSSWNENLSKGALPDERILLVARWAVAWLFPGTLLFAFLTAKRLFNSTAGWIVMILTATNALVLLHTRRAMAESSLLFFYWLTLWLIFKFPDKPWITALAAAMAFNAKYSAIPLLIILCLSIFFLPHGKKQSSLLKIWGNLLIVLGIFSLVTVLFNPFLWRAPTQALSAAIRERSHLSEAQSSQIGLNPNPTSNNYLLGGLTNLLSNMFIAPPAVEDVGNYSSALEETKTSYFQNPAHNILRGFVGGSLMLVFFIAGIIFWWLVFRSLPKRDFLLYAFGLLLQTGVILFLFSVYYQRYMISLLPYVTLATGYCLTAIIQNAKIIKNASVT